MKKLAEKQIRGRSRLRFHRWLWLLAILLVACASPVPPGTDSGANTADTPASPAEVVTEATAEVTEEPAGEPTVASTEEPLTESTDIPRSHPSVAIMVFDFFVPTERQNNSPSATCLAGSNGSTSEGAGSFGSTGADNKVVSTNIPHGELVYEHLKQQFTSPFTKLIPTTSVPDGLLKVEYTTINEETVVLAQVDIGGNVTDQTLSRILAAQDWLNDYEIDYYVVNMSVVIKPCGSVLQEDPEAYARFIQCIPELAAQQEFLNSSVDIPDKETKIKEMLLPRAALIAGYYVNPVTRVPLGCPTDENFGPGDVPDELSVVESESTAFLNRLGEEQLLWLTQDSDGTKVDNNLFFVAAAGNDGLQYPYAPAIYRQVVSVGSLITAGPPLSYSPNRAEWVLSDRFDWTVSAGAVVTVTEMGGQSPRFEDDIVTLGGTSFATPKLSYITALALLDGTAMPDCYDRMVYAAGPDLLPPNWFDWPNPPSGIPLIPDNIWKNLQIGDIHLTCPDFPLP